MSNLADLIIGVGIELDDVVTGFKKIPGMADDAIEGITQKFSQVADKLKPAMTAAGAAAGTALVLGATSAMETESVNDKLAAQLGLSASESQQAGKVAGSLYANAYGDSLGQVNDAVAGVAKALNVDLGDTATLERLSAKALDTATAFDMDLGTAINNAGGLMKSGLAADADEAFDLMVASLQKVNPALRDELSDATKEYSTFFGALGFSGAEALGLLASADDQFSLDKTGDAIKEFTIRATDMSASTQEVFFSMGMSAEDMSNRLLTGGSTARGAMDEIVDGLLAIQDPTAQANAAIALFGTPLEDLGTQKIPGFLSSLDTMSGGLGNVDEQASMMGDSLNDNAGSKIESARRKVDQFLQNLANSDTIFGSAARAAAVFGGVVEPLGPAIAGVGFIFRDQLGQVAGKLTGAAGSAAKWAASSVASFGKSAASVAQHTLQEAKWAAESVKNFAKATASTVANTAATVASKTAALAVAAAQKVWAAAQWALNAALNANPIMLVVTAIAALVAAAVLAYQNVDWFRSAVDTAWAAISAVIDWAWNTIIKPIFDNWQIALAVLLGPIGLLAAVVTSNWDRISGAISWAWNSVIKPVWDALWGFVETKMIPAFQTYWEVAQQVWSAVSGAVSAAWGVLGPIFSWIKDTLINAVVNQFNTARAVAESVWSAVSGAVSTAWGLISGAFGFIRDGVQTVIDKFFEIKDGVGNAFSGVADAIKSPFQSAFNAIKTLWNNTVGGFKFSVPDWIPGVGGKGFEIPRMHTGGVVPGTRGEEVLRILEAGELVIPANQVRALSRPRVASFSSNEAPQPVTAPRGDIVVNVNRPEASAYEIGQELLFDLAVAG